MSMSLKSIDALTMDVPDITNSVLFFSNMSPPHWYVYGMPSLLADTITSPGATTSGFSLPSNTGPKEENDARLPELNDGIELAGLIVTAEEPF